MTGKRAVLNRGLENFNKKLAALEASIEACENGTEKRTNPQLVEDALEATDFFSPNYGFDGDEEKNRERRKDSGDRLMRLFDAVNDTMNHVAMDYEDALVKQFEDRIKGNDVNAVAGEIAAEIPGLLGDRLTDITKQDCAFGLLAVAVDIAYQGDLEILTEDQKQAILIAALEADHSDKGRRLRTIFECAALKPETVPALLKEIAQFGRDLNGNASAGVVLEILARSAPRPEPA